MPRETAWRVLRSGDPKPLSAVDRFAAAAELEPRDRALVRRIVGTEIRRRGTLRAIVRHLARGKPKPDLVAHLHIGLVQLFFLDSVPPHAAVSETVRAASNTLGLSKGRYVNAVLRAAQRARRLESSGDVRRDLVGRDICFEAPIFHDPDEHPLLWFEDALSIPANLMKRWVERHGKERAFELARAAMDEPDLSLAAVGVPRDEVEGELASLGVELQRGAHPAVLVAPSSAAEAIFASEAFRAGRFTIQGETARRAADLVRAEEGERVLDLCAAPGGKTAVLAASGARVFATDRSAARLSRMASNLARLRAPGKVACVAMDGLGGLAPASAGTFDAVLVDAPCSNTGVLAARPGARWRFGPAAQRELTALQARLLEEAAVRVRSSGRLVYSTCSLESEENARLVRGFLERHGDWRLDEEHESLPAPAGGPGPVDGGYAARLLAP